MKWRAEPVVPIVHRPAGAPAFVAASASTQSAGSGCRQLRAAAAAMQASLACQMSPAASIAFKIVPAPICLDTSSGSNTPSRTNLPFT